MTSLEWSELWADAAKSMALRVAFSVAAGPMHPFQEERIRAVAKRALAAEKRRIHAWCRACEEELRRVRVGRAARLEDQGDYTAPAETNGK